jgi:hypothetical protein
MLIEGTLDGQLTGRRIVLPRTPGDTAFPYDLPTGPAYDPVGRRYFYTAFIARSVRAVDSTGTTLDGYPRQLQGYPSATLGRGLSVHGRPEGGPDGVRLEIPYYQGDAGRFRRIIVTDPLARPLGQESVAPTFGYQWQSVDVQGNALRSVFNPNGIMYFSYEGFDTSWHFGLAAVRPARLSPTWLTVDTWDGVIPAGGFASIPLTFVAGNRDPGVYSTTLAVQTNHHPPVSIPLVLTVTSSTGTDSPAHRTQARVSASPNPVTHGGEIVIETTAAAAVRMEVVDLVGRSVWRVSERSLSAGRHSFPLDAGGIAPGLYIIRGVVDGNTNSTLMTVVR